MCVSSCGLGDFEIAIFESITSKTILLFYACLLLGICLKRIKRMSVALCFFFWLFDHQKREREKERDEQKTEYGQIVEYLDLLPCCSFCHVHLSFIPFVPLQCTTHTYHHHSVGVSKTRNIIRNKKKQSHHFSFALQISPNTVSNATKQICHCKFQFNAIWAYVCLWP